MQAVRCWVGTLLLMAVVIGCGGMEEAGAPPEDTAPRKVAVSQESPAPQAALEPSPKITPPPSIKPEASPAPMLEPERVNPLRSMPAQSPNIARSQNRSMAAPRRSMAMKKAPPSLGSALDDADLLSEYEPEEAASDEEYAEEEAMEESSSDTEAFSFREEKSSSDAEAFYFMEEAEEQDADEEELDYTVVKVYYATDRSPLDVAQWRFSQRGGWPKLTGICAVLTAVLMLWRPRRRKIVIRSLAWIFLMTTVVIGGLTIVYQWQPESNDRPIERMYGNDRGELELGTCEVSVPKSHEVGKLESPTVLRLEFRQDPERHVVLLGVHPESPSEFYADLRACIDQTASKEAFVFIHGYNVGFESAVRRTAQIAYDLKFEGAPIVYSWPSQEGLLSYTIDETNVVWTVPHLKEFLVDVAERSGAESVHLVAHSMGNRALTSALCELVRERKEQCPQFHQVILTAPDIDADVFRRDIAPAIVGTAQRVTLYASSNDEALMASRTVHGYRRAGESGDHLVVVPGVDTVDVSDVDTSLIGHSYYGSNSTVLADLFELMQGSKSPDQRRWLQSMRQGVLKYWKFFRDHSHSSPTSSEEI